MSEADIRAERVKKIELLREAGMEAYPAHSERDTSISGLIASFDNYESGGKEVTIAGRVMARRGQGGIMFADIFDGSGRVQVVLQADVSANVELFERAVDTGDFVQFSGAPFKTKRGERSIKVSNWKMLSKSLLPIPDEWFGIKDEELRLRERDIDILMSAELRAMFERRSKFWQAARNFYLAQGFLEVETPILETTPGGADARPFVTHHNALDIEVYLRISAGELWQKRLLIGGFPKVFEIGRIFRNEGQSREHLQDYTQLESYEAYADMQSGMHFVQELYRHIAKEVYGTYTFEIAEHVVDLAEDWKIVNFSEAIKKEFDINPLTASESEIVHAASRAGATDAPNKERAVDYLWKKIRKGIAGPAFLTGVPVYLEPLAKRAKDGKTVERIQILMAGSEIGKGYSELNDPQDQRARFEEQQKLRDKGDDEAQRMDETYVRAMEYGMPPAFGFGVSERLFAFLENKPAHETQLFPLLRPKQEKFSNKAAEKRYRSKRVVVIADPSAGYGVTANAVGQLGISIGGFSNERLFDTTMLKDADGRMHYVDGLYPMVNLAGDQKAMAAFMMKCYEAAVQVFDFSDIMRKAHSDEEMLKGYAQKKTNDIGYLAVGALVPVDFEKEFLETLSRFE